MRTVKTSPSQVEPLERTIPADRQGAKRHYGVHPYFTRRPYNVVRDYILHYSRPGDTVVDPFGGSGVTAIEAWLENRVGVQNDINPLANFIAAGVAGLSQGAMVEYEDAAAELRTRCERELAKLERCPDEELSKWQTSRLLPANIRLPKSADVEWYRDLFSERQLISLAIIREAVDALPAAPRGAFLLAWSATLAKINKTFLSADGRAESRGGSSIFSIYRYKVAKAPVELPVWSTFLERVRNVLAAKLEIDRIIEHKRKTGGFFGRFEVSALDVEEFADRRRGQVDYIFTDPPYGGHISYLDLSTLWNHWLGVSPTAHIRSNELIVGGDLAISDQCYIERLGRAISSCMQMVKAGKWLTVVFQHWNIEYFEAILNAADRSDGQLRAAVSQVGDPIWSMHKKKGKDSVLAGEMLLTFCKTPGRSEKRPSLGHFDVEAAVDAILAKSSGRLYGEFVFNKLVVEAWRARAIGALAVTKSEITEMLERRGWMYDPDGHYWCQNATQTGLFG